MKTDRTFQRAGKRAAKALILSLAFAGLQAQAPMYAQTTVAMPDAVNLIKMTDAGIALVGTDEALHAINAESNEVWRHEKLKKVEAERVEVLSGSELVFVSDKGMLARNRVLNVLDGREYANTGAKGENIFGARVVHGTNQLWVMQGQKRVQVWDIASNTMVYDLNPDVPHGMATNKSAALTATFQGMQPITYTGKSSAIVHLGLAHLAEYDLSNGKVKWAFDWKPYKGTKPDKGGTASNPSSGFAVMKIDESDQTLYFPFNEQLIAVDAKNGQPRWDPKGGKTGKVFDLHVLDQGILILTMKGLQMINKASGEPMWDKPIKLKGADESLLVDVNGTFYAVSKSAIVKVDLDKGTATPLTEKIKFAGGESFSQLDALGDLLVLQSEQNAVGVNRKTGEVAYTVYYKPPGQGALAIAQNMALAAVAMAATMNSQRINSTGGNTTGGGSAGTVRYHQYTPAMMQSGGSATTSGNGVSYMSTKFKEADANGFGVARVDLNTGETTQRFVTGQRDAVYDVDAQRGLIFYKSGKEEITISAIR